MNIKKVIAIFLFWPDYWVILEGKMSYLKIGKIMKKTTGVFPISATPPREAKGLRSLRCKKLNSCPLVLIKSIE